MRGSRNLVPRMPHGYRTGRTERPGAGERVRHACFPPGGRIEATYRYYQARATSSLRCRLCSSKRHTLPAPDWPACQRTSLWARDTLCWQIPRQTQRKAQARSCAALLATPPTSSGGTKHHLPFKIAIGRDGRLTREAGDFAGLTTREARNRIVETLEERGLVLARQPVTQSVRVHERCDTPVEYIVTRQWFVRVLDFKKELIEAGEQVHLAPSPYEGTLQRMG